MICCGKNRKSNFCPDCGKPVDFDSIKSGLVGYIHVQKTKIESNYKSRLRHNPEMLGHDKDRWEKNIKKKWGAWLEWVTNATQKVK